MCTLSIYAQGNKADLDRILSQMPFSCWFIWRARREAVFNLVHPSSIRTSRAIAFALGSFKSASLSSRTLRSSRPSIPPPNVDACWKVGAQHSLMGIVARNCASMCINVRCVEVLTSSAAIAEALSVLEGCLLAKNLQFQEVVIESDAKEVICPLNSTSLSWAWDLPPILSHVQEVGMMFDACSWSSVPRSVNMAADFVARNISREMCSFGWVVRPPSFLVRSFCG